MSNSRKVGIFFILFLFLGLTQVLLAAPNPPKLFDFDFDKSSFLLPDSTKDSTRTKKIYVPPLSQDTQGDPFSSGSLREPSPLSGLAMPDNFKFRIELDSSRQFYNVYERFGLFSKSPVSRISLEDFQRMQDARLRREYSYQKSKETDAKGFSGGKGGLLDGLDSLSINLPESIAKILGSNTIDIQLTGALTLDFGGRWQRIDNPQIPVRQQRNGAPYFDQRIQLGLTGKIGDKININTDWDTKPTFQFENVFNQGYSGYEHDIIQQIQFGNVSLSTSNSLITGGQNLFGIGTKLRFGKLWVNTIFSSVRGTAESIKVQNGAQGKPFELRADDYEPDRHFFLSHFFRENYEQSLKTAPIVTSGVNITRVEIYVTNRNNNTQTLRNIAGFMDLGEQNPYRESNPNLQPIQAGAPASNTANGLFENLKNNADTRNPDLLHQTMQNQFSLQQGTDYELLRGSRKLNENEYFLQPQLGYITLLQPLRNDEIVCVSYEYTYLGKVYKVGELTEDYQNFTDDKVLHLKMLSPSTIRTDLPTWDLMMKNIYSLQANQIEQENFQLRVIYRDDRTGIDNPSLHEGKNTANIPLVQLFGLDRLNPNLDPQPDGNFDFMDGITINRDIGRVIFPVLEPFGEHLNELFNPATEVQFIDKYVFKELYEGTQADAKLRRDKSKFFIKGSYQGQGGSEILLPGINIARNSVVVRAGNTILQEGTDYTVDYQFGRVRILNQSIMNSGREITIDYERADLFRFQQRSLMGMDLEYHFNKDIKMTGTLLHLNERPIITRVSLGNEPVRNTLWGLTLNLRKDSRLLTKLVDKIPGVDTKAPSSITFDAEFAQLIPGTNKLIKKGGGTVFVDDFESAETPYDLTRQPTLWNLGSTPQNFLQNSNPLDTLSTNYKRAKLAWYSIDNSLYATGAGGTSRPSNISSEDIQNHYVRLVGFDEIFKGKDAQQINQPEQTFDLAYYPDERGAYNYTTDLSPSGRLKNPKDNFGAITRAITQNIDFDNINVQYVEFWMLDPFLGADGNERGDIIRNFNGNNTRNANRTGGELYFNLGNISEDVIPDNRHSFENGLPANDEELNKVTRSAWGKVGTKQYLNNAFSSEDGARTRQDVGFDGLTDDEEKEFFEGYLNTLKGKLDANFYNEIEADPSGDNFQYYLGADADNDDLKLFDRYKNFNGTEANSPEGANTASSSFIPDNEDLNRDNTVSSLEAYYQYKVDLFPNELDVASHPYIVDAVETPAEGSGDPVTWYQFRIPVREFQKKVGNIEGFKSIRYIRMFMTGWEEPVVLRMANFQFVGSQWRPFFDKLQTPGLGTILEPYEASFNISTVNIIENGSESGQAGANGNTPYVLPPDFERDTDASSITNARLNEQSLQLCVEGLQDTDSRAAFKDTKFDFIQFERLKMFIHAESQDAKDEEMTAYVRLGTDFTNNYYEIEVPLYMTPDGSTQTLDIWKEENNIDIAFDDIYNVKSDRNRNNLSSDVPYSKQVEKYKVTVVGNPDMSNVQVVLLGVRNPRSEDQLPKSACVWMNELRVTGFRKSQGWAANARMNAQLADFATVSSSIRYSTPGFGGIQTRLSALSRETNLYYDVASNIQLDKMFLGKLGISLPLYVAFEKNVITPQYNPLDPDTKLNQSLTNLEPGQRDFYSGITKDIMTRRSFNLTNVHKKKMRKGARSNFWDIENLSMNLGFSEMKRTNATTAVYENREAHLGMTYNYSFKNMTFEPFKKFQTWNSPYLKLIKDFNISPLPSSIAITGNLERRFIKTQLRNADLTTEGILPNYEKSFTFDRNYNVRWGLTKNLNIDYTALAHTVIDEPAGDIKGNKIASDSIIANILSLGRMKYFQQNINATYKVPFNKFPLTEWLGADARYTAGYNWTASPLGIMDTLGNMARNTANLTLNGQINLEKIYNKSPYLRKIAAPKQIRQRANRIPYKAEKRKRLQFKVRRILTKEKKVTTKKDAKIQKKKDKLKGVKAKKKPKKNKKNKNLNDSTQVEELEKPLTIVDTTKLWNEETFKPIVDKHDKKQVKLKAKEEKYKEKLAALTKLQRLKRSEKVTENPVMDGLIRAMLSLKKVNVNYSKNTGSTLPGFLPVPKYAGMDESFEAPGLPFVLGSQNRSTLLDLLNKGYVSKSALQTMPMMQNQVKTLGFQATLQPMPDFTIQLTAQRSTTSNFSEVIRFDPAADAYAFDTPIRNGNYNISFMSIGTAFSKNDSRNNSSLFDDFIQYRSDMKTTLDGLNENGTYQLSSQDVMIPAFIAAYTGKSPTKTSAFPRIPLPNWKVTFSGLSKLEKFKNVLRSFSIDHAYTSTYSIGNYTSSLLYNGNIVGPDVSEYDIPLPTFDPLTNELVPVLVMSQVSIIERFAPFIGVNIRTKSDVTVRVAYNKQRSLMLNLSNAQLTELKNNDITLDVGFKKKKVKVPFSDYVLENDLTFRLAFTLRDTKTLQRKITEDNLQETTVTNGNLNWQFKPTLSYMVNKTVDLTAYFERTVNSPLISNSFRRSNTNFGVQIRINLAQ
jgi:cell surface protein SprA